MWLPSVVTVAPTAEPLDTETAVAHLRAQGAGDETEIDALVAAARAYVEAYTGTRLITQTVVARTEDWEDLEALPIGPVQSITSIAYTDFNGSPQTLSTSIYSTRLYGLSPSVELKYNQVWPVIQCESLIEVTMVVGYGAAAAVPADLAHAVKLVLGDLYRFRATAQVGDTTSAYPMAPTVEALLSNHRMFL